MDSFLKFLSNIDIILLIVGILSILLGIIGQFNSKWFSIKPLLNYQRILLIVIGFLFISSLFVLPINKQNNIKNSVKKEWTYSSFPFEYFGKSILFINDIKPRPDGIKAQYDYSNQTIHLFIRNDGDGPTYSFHRLTWPNEYGLVRKLLNSGIVPLCIVPDQRETSANTKDGQQKRIMLYLEVINKN
ncbi:MAG: hypothetical protein C4517_17655 [Stygiobacter sp.]|nr:MAG: hypothetical protein C4517_17655 [Stygiobacter sp.]